MILKVIQIWMFILSFIIGLVMGMWALPAHAETTVWTWLEQDNVKCYTNDETRIPSKYKEVATSFVVDGLEDYKKFTPINGRQVISEE